MLHIQNQSNIPCHSGEKVDLTGFAVFNIGIHLGFSTKRNFIKSEALKSGHAACKI